MKEYIQRLVLAGMRIGDASVIVQDFFRDSDIDGLQRYVLEFEKIHEEACYVHPV